MMKLRILLLSLSAILVVWVLSPSSINPGPSVEEIERRGILYWAEGEGYTKFFSLAGPVKSFKIYNTRYYFKENGWFSHSVEPFMANSETANYYHQLHNGVEKNTVIDWESEAHFLSSLDKNTATITPNIETCELVNKSSVALDYQCERTFSKNKRQIIQYNQTTGLVKIIVGEKLQEVLHYDQEGRLTSYQRISDNNVHREQFDYSQTDIVTFTSTKETKYNGSWFERQQQYLSDWWYDKGKSRKRVETLRIVQRDKYQNPTKVKVLGKKSAIATITYQYQ